MKIFSGIQPTGAKHFGNWSGGFRQYAATQERAAAAGGAAFFCIVDLHSITVDYDPAGPARAHARSRGAALCDRPRPGALDGVRPEPRDRARRGRLAALGGDELRAARADDPVQGERGPPGARDRGALHLPDPDGRRHPALRHGLRPDRTRISASISSSRATSPSGSTRASARPSRSPMGSTRRSARGSWTCRSRRRRCRRPAGRRRERC